MYHGSPIYLVSLCFWALSAPLDLCMTMQFALANAMQTEVVCVTVCESFGSQRHNSPYSVFSTVASIKTRWYEGAVKMKQPGLCWTNTWRAVRWECSPCSEDFVWVRNKLCLTSNFWDLGFVCYCSITELILTNSHWILISILWWVCCCLSHFTGEKLKHREGRKLAKDHTNSKRQNQLWTSRMRLQNPCS